jgi:hypothetical protein
VLFRVVPRAINRARPIWNTILKSHRNVHMVGLACLFSILLHSFYFPFFL